ncbi:MAG: hypothetical protein FJ312_02320 [SAR202 cluster bacterium]|nr:hypothetical protein [SAR202 cluster bacterium]
MALQDGRVLIISGIAFHAVVELYDPATSVWSDGPAMGAPRYRHSATLLTDGRVLIAAGVDSTGILGEGEVYAL